MNGEIEKIDIKLIIINLIIWIPLILLLTLIIGISKVEALDIRWATDNGWENWQTVTYTENYSKNNYHLNQNWTSIAQARENYSMNGNNIYDYRLDFEYKLNMIGKTSIDLFSTMVPYLYNGSNLVEITHKCQFQVTQYDGTYNSGPYRIIRGTMVCTQISGSGYYPYLVFRARQSTNQSAYLTTATLNFTNSILQINTGSTDANNIIYNDNANTTTIVNNNNANTERIIESNQSWGGSINNDHSTSDLAFNKEGQIINAIDTDIELEELKIDTTTNNLIWEWTHRILFTNTLLGGITLTLLTLGIIKLILGR